MSEMVERVARTLHKVGDDRSEPDFRVPWADCAPKYQQYMRESARAAIEAMFEPTEAMVQGALNADLDIYWGYRAAGPGGGPEDVWRAMLAAALATPPEPQDAGK